VAPLPEGVDAEAGEIVVLIGDVEIAGLLERFETLGRSLSDCLEDGLRVTIRQDWALLQWAEVAVATKDRRDADLQVDVARAELDGAPEQGIQFHGGHTCIGMSPRRL
jgi:alkylhydroperoxidase family enzyme